MNKNPTQMFNQTLKVQTQLELQILALEDQVGHIERLFRFRLYEMYTLGSQFINLTNHENEIRTWCLCIGALER